MLFTTVYPSGKKSTGVKDVAAHSESILYVCIIDVVAEDLAGRSDVDPSVLLELGGSKVIPSEPVATKR
jgi:hypothetical protein